MGVPWRSQHRGVEECVLELAIEVRPCLAVASGAVALTPPPASPAAPICRLSVHIPRSLSSHHTQISLLFLHPQAIGIHSTCRKSNSADCELITPKVNIFSLHTILHLFLHPQATELHNSTHKKTKQTKGFIKLTESQIQGEALLQYTPFVEQKFCKS